MTSLRATHFEGPESLHLLQAQGAIARVRSGKRTFTIDLRTGAATPGADSAPPPSSYVDRSAEALALARTNWTRAKQLGWGAESVPVHVPIEIANATITVREDCTADEPLVTTFTSRDRTSVAVPGEPIEIVTEDGVLAAICTTRGVFVVDSARRAVLASFATTTRQIAMASRDDLVAVATGGALHLVFRNGHWLRTWAAGLPDAVAITDAFVLLLAGLDLFAIDRGILANASKTHSPFPPHDIDFEIAPRADARNDDEVCVVRTVVQRFVALTEVRRQRHFNFTLAEGRLAQRFAKGDRVYVIDGRLVRESELPANYGTPTAVVHAARDLSPVVPVGPPPEHDRVPTDAARALQPLRDTLGFEPSPRLVRFIERHGSIWKWPWGAFTPDLAKPDVGIPVDPCLVILFDLQSGDYVCTYDYPPAGRDGHVFVRYNHDEDGLVWLGENFEDAFAASLRDELKYAAPTVVELLRGLSLPITFLDEHPGTAPPAWFTAAHPKRVWPRPAASEMFAQAEQLERAADLIAAERAYVRALHESLDRTLRDAIRAKLARVYAALGWGFQAGRV